jgi:aldehyde dehydrogenase (NAD+)
VTIEAGKIASEGAGEVQEMIDICDFAVGLSRQLTGLTIATERRDHRMMETWHPLGVVGIISAFNFPVAVWSWNAALALVCGDPCVWKPSEKTPLTALATQALFARAAAGCADAPAALSSVLLGGPRSARRWSTTGGCRWCRRPARPRWAARWRRGWPRASPRAPRAGRQQRRDRRAVGRPRAGGAGDRLRRDGHRRPALHDAAPAVRPRRDLRRAGAAAAQGWASVAVGDPRDAGTLVGPLIDDGAARRWRRR